MHILFSNTPNNFASKMKITIAATAPGQLVRCVLNSCPGTGNAPMRGSCNWTCYACGKEYIVTVLDAGMDGMG